jgi:hypothetical protein
MPKKGNDNPGKYVSQKFCDERFGRVLDKLTGIDDKLTSKFKSIDSKLTEIKEEKKQRGRDWKSLLLSIVSGGMVAVIAWLLSTHL